MVRFLFLISFLFLNSYKTSAQIVLLDEPVPFKPNGFYVAEVLDERADKNTIAQLDLKGGTTKAMGLFIDHNLLKNKALRPVVISLKEFKFAETPLKDGNTEGQITLYLSFNLQKNYGLEYLTDYHTTLHYTRHGNNVAAIEHSLHLNLMNGIIYFNDWMKANADSNRKLAKDVKISFTDYREKIEGDTIYYAAKRPLTWADFQSHIRATSKFEAQVMPGIGYNQQAEDSKGTIHVDIAMKVYVPKSACWADYTGRNDYTLNHEQRHFDIVKIIGEQFKQKLLAAKPTPDTFEALINMQYLDSYRDMDTMQKAYDKETNHGANTSAQAMWNDRIDKELKSISRN